MEVDIHEEVIKVITVELLVHIRISNYASNNMTFSTGAMKYREVQNNSGGRGSGG